MGRVRNEKCVINKTATNNSLYAIAAWGSKLNRISLLSFGTVVRQQYNKYHYCIKLKNVIGYSIYEGEKKTSTINLFYCGSLAHKWTVCKVFNLVPRHQEIVARILRDDHAQLLTTLIGILEIVMAIWILSGIRTRLNALTQIVVIATMNTLEFFLVPELLLRGRVNAFFAFLFLLVIYYNEFHMDQKLSLQP